MGGIVEARGWWDWKDWGGGKMRFYVVCRATSRCLASGRRDSIEKGKCRGGTSDVAVQRASKGN